jgi:hypothetical protein
MWRLIVVLGAALVAVQVKAETQERKWPVYVGLVSGQNSYCSNGGNLWVREGNRKFAVFGDKDARYEVWILPLAADCSVAGETKNVFKRLIRAAVPSGFGPREFDTTDLIHACRFHWTPR